MFCLLIQLSRQDLYYSFVELLQNRTKFNDWRSYKLLLYAGWAKCPRALMQGRCCTVLWVQKVPYIRLFGGRRDHFLVADVTTFWWQMWPLFGGRRDHFLVADVTTFWWQTRPLSHVCGSQYQLVEVTPNSYSKRKYRMFTVTFTIDYILVPTEAQGLLNRPV
jgi:hypothetical protein